MQRYPALFSWLQGVVDADGRMGLFILTGSQQFGLISGITQSLRRDNTDNEIGRLLERGEHLQPIEVKSD